MKKRFLTALHQLVQIDARIDCVSQLHISCPRRADNGALVWREGIEHTITAQKFEIGLQCLGQSNPLTPWKPCLLSRIKHISWRPSHIELVGDIVDPVGDFRATSQNFQCFASCTPHLPAVSDPFKTFGWPTEFHTMIYFDTRIERGFWWANKGPRYNGASPLSTSKGGLVDVRVTWLRVSEHDQNLKIISKTKFSFSFEYLLSSSRSCNAICCTLFFLPFPPPSLYLSLCLSSFLWKFFSHSALYFFKYFTKLIVADPHFWSAIHRLSMGWLKWSWSRGKQICHSKFLLSCAWFWWSRFLTS